MVGAALAAALLAPPAKANTLEQAAMAYGISAAVNQAAMCDFTVNLTMLELTFVIGDHLDLVNSDFESRAAYWKTKTLSGDLPDICNILRKSLPDDMIKKC
jgi:hypothetical protein